MPYGEPKVLIVILNYKTPQLTLNLVDALKKIHYQAFDIMVIDNDSPDDSAKILGKYAQEKGFILYSNHVNAGYAAGNNIGIRYAIHHGYRYTWILNSDVLLLDLDVLKLMVQRAEEDAHIGVVGPLIINRDDTEVGPYLYRPTLWRSTLGIFADKRNRMNHIHTAGSVYRVYGCCMLLKNEAMEKCDCMDERTFLYSEEDILAERLLKYGYYAYYEPTTRVKHNESSSMRTLTLEQIRRKDKEIFKSRALYYKEYLKYNSFKIQLIYWTRRFISLVRNL
ncbi:glycosyltransferase family 2 protein [Acidaminococcus fermentans]|uniref:glycosyltransferase family 2 protein n=1 Tax=Acidaminococcus fermentans TaxID=905 RepID=UPI002E75BC02|nr:glycosyltransferase family 2 protein [Acidaminococcus fermentans]MEE1598205.1 glycosyltransferase family 2 protein [Acidaminococcus fermentans]MEE4122467.1 glycosyltransferase family 2 protein [Acidaminococcus fermentans]